MDYEEQQVFEEAQEKIREQQEMLRELTGPAYMHGTVVTHAEREEDDKTKTTLIISVGGRGVMEVDEPFNLKVEDGAVVRLNSQTMNVIGIVGVDTTGGIATVVQAGEAMSQIEADGRVIQCFNGKLELKDGDRVVLDESLSVAVSNLGQKQRRFRFAGTTGIRWDDIGGLEEAKRQMRETVELPYERADLYRHYGKRPIKGVLLYGPPGCGKTMLGKATATALARLHKADEPGFFYMKGPEVLDRFVGVAEATIRQVFAQARKHKEEHGYPAVVFLDEADALLGKRGTGKSSDMERTIVPTFLTEMDGLEESSAIVILATNRPDVLDPAAVRDGRVDRKVKVDRPTEEGVKEIFKLNLKEVPLCGGLTKAKMAKEATTALFDPKHVLYKARLKRGGSVEMTLANMVNGAMVAGIVDQATSLAMFRDMDAGNGEGGITVDDVKEATAAVVSQNRDMNHDDEIMEFAEEVGDVVGMTKATA